ncbi:MAG: hypothetical protein DRI70_04700 [Bacteroidetes bacterium]|nr:MAG: hypothetical protein DRI70_04700 [Bacteroidota bacterium]
MLEAFNEKLTKNNPNTSAVTFFIISKFKGCTYQFILVGRVQLLNYQRPCQKSVCLDLQGVRDSLFVCWNKIEETRQDLEKMRDGFSKKLTNQKTILLITFYSAITAVQILIIRVIINIIVVIII